MEYASSDSKNRAAAGFIQRFQNTAMCSTGLGAAPQQAENHSFRESGMDGFSHLYIQMHCLRVLLTGIVKHR